LPRPCLFRLELNGVPWVPELENVRKNEGTNRFLPAGIGFSTARIAARKGRDLATMWSDKDAVWVWFADNPDGDDAYELEISSVPPASMGPPNSPAERQLPAWLPALRSMRLAPRCPGATTRCRRALLPHRCGTWSLDLLRHRVAVI
jgi:hypothetical protein